MLNVKDLRNGVVARLAGNTNAGSNVYSSKITPHMAQSVPAIAVYTPSLSAEHIGRTTPIFRRSIDISIDVIVMATTDWSDAVDDIVLQIKETLFQDETWVIQFVEISGYTEEHTLHDEGDKPIAISTLTITGVLVEPESYS